jgi:hypothetical protein
MEGERMDSGLERVIERFPEAFGGGRSNAMAIDRSNAMANLRSTALPLGTVLMATVLLGVGLAGCAGSAGGDAEAGAATEAATLVPLEGQTSEQMTADQQECASQATAQTGYNPSAPPTTTAAESGGRVAGAAKGAAVGKVTSNVTENTETDEAKEAGAKAGVMVAGSQKRQGRREEREQQAQIEQQASAYNDALSACLQSRGYSFQ